MANWAGQNTDDVVIKNSFIIIDAGSVTTSAILIDVVDNEYRFIAHSESPTTLEPPNEDIMVGIKNAIFELEHITGRQMLEENRLITPQRSDAQGVDGFLATVSAADPMRVLVMGVIRDVSAESARRATESIYTNLIDVVTIQEDNKVLAESATKDIAEGQWIDDQVRKLQQWQPEVVILAGGIDGTASAPVEKLARIISLVNYQPPTLVGLDTLQGRIPLVYAGTTTATGAVTRELETRVRLITVPNVRPVIDRENLAPARAAFADIYSNQVLNQLPGYNRLARWSDNEILPTVLASGMILRYAARQDQREILLADVGANSISLVHNSAHDFTPVVRGNFGLAYSITNILAEVGVAAVQRWLPFESDDQEIWHWALNKSLRPYIIPITMRDLAIEQSLTRLALRTMIKGLRSQNAATYDLLVGAGGPLIHTANYAQAAMILLDGLEPEGLTLGSLTIALDLSNLLPALGILAKVNPAAATYIYDRDCLLRLGTCIVPIGTAAEGAKAVTVTLEFSDGTTATHTVTYGSIACFPFTADQKARLIVQPAAGFRIGQNDYGKEVKTEPGAEIIGGALGLIIDARGRPLILPESKERRMSTLRRWMEAIGVYTGNAEEIFKL